MNSALRGNLEELLPAIAEREGADPETYPGDSVEALYSSGVISAPFSPELGGSSASLEDAVKIIERLATASPSVALISAMPLGLASICALGPEVAPEDHRSGYADQIGRIARDYDAGRIYAACNSEKGAGGSLDATRTTAVKRPGGEFAINGEKILASTGRNAATFFSTAKVDQSDLPGAGVVEFFLLDSDAPGVEIADDWDGFGMWATESQTVRYNDASAREMFAFPDFLKVVEPLSAWAILFAAIPLGCALSILEALGDPSPGSAAMRLRLSEAQMRYEAMRAYLLETAAAFRPAAGNAYAARAMRAKTYVSEDATRLCAELFALSGGRNYRRNSPVARALADSFAGTALRPPLALALETMSEEFSIDDGLGSTPTA